MRRGDQKFKVICSYLVTSAWAASNLASKQQQPETEEIQQQPETEEIQQQPETEEMALLMMQRP